MSAAEVMQAALLAMLNRDQRPPCAEPGAPDPCSDDDDEREAAEFRCCRCSIRRQCGDLGDEVEAKHHVWGGVDRTPRPGRKPKGAAA